MELRADRKKRCGPEKTAYAMTKEQKEQTIGLLFAEKCSCVVRNGDEVRIFRERGVKDLYRLLGEEPPPPGRGLRHCGERRPASG